MIGRFLTKVIFIILFAVVSTQAVYADMESFINHINEAEKEKPDKSSHTASTNSANDDDDDDSLFIIIMELFIQLWPLNNLYIYYAPYPYYPNGYIRRPWNFYPEQYTGNDFTNRTHWFSTSVSGFYLKDIGYGPWLNFSGNLYKFFGPSLDGFLTSDGDKTLYGLRAGLQFSLLQFNGISMNLYWQWQLWSHPSLERSGSVFGLEVRLYPIKPITIRLKWGGQFFEHFTMSDFEVQAGFMIKAWELYGGWRSWNLSAKGDPQWTGFFGGIRYYF